MYYPFCSVLVRLPWTTSQSKGRLRREQDDCPIHHRGIFAAWGGHGQILADTKLLAMMLSMDYPWTIHGLSMDDPSIINGQSMDYQWTIHWLSMDNQWIIY